MRVFIQPQIHSQIVVQVTLPKGVVQKSAASIKKQKFKALGPKLGMHGTVTPRRPAAVIEHKIEMAVTKAINETNRTAIAQRADIDQGCSGK
jgi:hypothetical protein